MSDTLPFTHPLRLADLAGRKPTRFRLEPDAAARGRIAAAVGASAVRALRFEGELSPQGRRDWQLRARLSAQVEQPCIVTLAPVTTEIAEAVARSYLADMPEPEAEEIEMPEDDSVEALPAVLDLGAVLIEALTLALPLYPRAEGAELGTARFAEPGTEPLDEEATRPFAGLADMLKKPGKDG